LESELVRWSQSIVDLGEYLKVIIGDVLLACAFVSFVGPFNKSFRDKIVYDNFVPYCREHNIPMGGNPNPV
jgi:dynein heavy chain